MDMRGLAHFIQDIRKATSNRDEERRRVEQELAKIRSKFKNSDTLTMYDRKKYLCKLMFVLMLGYRVDFGHMEGIRLLAVNEAAEKLIGYLSLTVFLNEGHELVMLTTHVVHLDLLSTVDLRVSLALTAISNIGNADFVEPMTEGIRKLILTKQNVGGAAGSGGGQGGSGNSGSHDESTMAKAMAVGTGTGANPQIKKKALLAYLHSWRKNRLCAELSEVLPVAADLIGHSNFGVAMAAVTFIEGVISEKDENPQWFAKAPANLVRLLSKIILEKLTEPEYVYYGVPAPWLQAKALRLLQAFPPFTDEQPQLLSQLHLVLGKMIKATERVVKEAQSLQRQRGTANRSNAMNCALVELVSLVVLHRLGSKILTEVSDVVTLYLNDKKDANMRYLGLQLLSRLSFASGVDGYAFSTVFQQAQAGIIVALHDPSDTSLKRQALSLLYTTCDVSNVVAVVADLLAYLPATKKDAFRAELVLTIASLTERYMTDVIWYIDTMMHVVWHGGDDVSRDVWGRVFHVVLNNPDVQKRAAEAALTQLKHWGTGSTNYLGHASSSPVVVRLAVIVLGEFGYQIGLNVDAAPIDQYHAVASKLPFVDRETKAMILTTLTKFYNLFDNAAVREKLIKTLEVYTSNVDTELQQRAQEYLALIQDAADETLQTVLEPLPGMAIGSVLRWRAAAPGTASSTGDVWEKQQREREEAQTVAAALARDGSPQQSSKHVDPSASVEPASATTPPLPLNAVGGALSIGNGTAQSQSASDAKGVLDALFSFDEPSTPTPSASAKAKSATALNAEYYRALTATKQSGVLYQDDYVVVECHYEVRKADARVTLSIQNRAPESFVLKQLELRLASTSGALLVQSRGTMETESLAGEPMRLQVAARCLAAFEDPPAYRLQYTPVRVHSNAPSAPRQVLLQLPVLPFCFMSRMDSEGQSLTLEKQVEVLVQQTRQLHEPTVVSLQASASANAGALSRWLHVYMKGDVATVTGGKTAVLSSLCTNPAGELRYLPAAIIAELQSQRCVVSIHCTDLSFQSALAKCLERLQTMDDDDAQGPQHVTATEKLPFPI